MPRARLARFAAAALAAALVAAGPRTALAGASFVYDATDGEALHAHLPDQRWPPASLTKLMTVYLALQAVEEGRLTLDSPVAISANANDQPFNTMGYKADHTLPLDTALRLMLVKSANDVAVAVAETVGGTEEAFVAAMNTTAGKLGMANTRFANPNGIHSPAHFSTAHDMALLGAAIWRDLPGHGELFGLKSIEVGGRKMKNYNPLLGTLAGADGMKTGYVCESGYNLVGSVSIDGRRLIAVVLGATSEAERAETATRLMRQAAEGGSGASGQGPAHVQEEPVNLRPHVCGGTPVPKALSGF